MTALLTVADVARRLRCSERRVRGLIASGALPALRDGRNVRITPADVDTYVEALQQLRGLASAELWTPVMRRVPRGWEPYVQAQNERAASS